MILEVDEFKRMLAALQNTMPGRSPAKSHKCVRLASDGNSVTLTCHSAGGYYKAELTYVEAHESSEIFFEADIVSNYLKTVHDGAVEVKGNAISIRDAKGRVAEKFTFAKGEAPPPPPSPGEVSSFYVIDSDELAQSISLACQFCHKEDARYALGSIQLDSQKDGFVVAGTDSATMMLAKHPPQEARFTGLIPKDIARKLVNLLTGIDISVRVGFSASGSLVIESEDKEKEFFCTTAGSQSAVWPWRDVSARMSYDSKYEVLPALWRHAAEKASIVVDDGHPMNCELSAEKITINASGERGEFSNGMPVAKTSLGRFKNFRISPKNLIKGISPFMDDALMVQSGKHGLIFENQKTTVVLMFFV